MSNTRLEGIHTLLLPECQGILCSKQARYFPPSMGTRKNPVIKLDNLTPPTTIVSADKESKERNAKIVWIEYY